MIIDSTYFEKGILFIPNNKDLNAEPVATPTVKSDLDLLIDKCERDLLLPLLGIDLYNELKLAMADLPNANQKWRDLVEGKTYTKDSKNIVWNGLKGINKQGVLYYFVWCKYQEENEFTLTTVGVVKNQSANAENADYSPKYVQIWNLFLKEYQSDLNTSPIVVQNAFGMIGLDYYGSSNAESSLLQFLKDHDTDFPGVNFKSFESKNTFGI